MVCMHGLQHRMVIGGFSSACASLLQDPDQAAVAAIDLARRRPAAAAKTGAAAAERCSCAPMDEQHFRTRPGLRVLQMAWHPGACSPPAAQ
jgi:nuclear pore complex protein Nup88